MLLFLFFIFTTLLHSLSHFALFMPCCTHYHASLFSCLVALEVTPCFSHIVPCCFHTLHPVAFAPSTLLLSLCLVAIALSCWCFHALLHLIVTPCYSCTLLLAFLHLIVNALTLFCCLCFATLPSRLGACLFQVPPHPRPKLLFHCFATCYCVLLLYFISWYSFLTLLCNWRNLEQHQ